MNVEDKEMIPHNTCFSKNQIFSNSLFYSDFIKMKSEHHKKIFFGMLFNIFSSFDSSDDDSNTQLFCKAHLLAF